MLGNWMMPFVLLQWRVCKDGKQHFDSVLSTASVFFLDLINSFPSSDIHYDLTDVPSLDKIRKAFALVVRNKAGSINRILLKMVKICSDKLLMYLFDLFTGV